MNPFRSIFKSPLSLTCALTAVLIAGCGGSNLDPVLGTPGAVVTLPTPVVPVVPVVPGDVTRPTVVQTIPAPGETNVPINRSITAVFSEDMAPASLSGTSFTVTNTTTSAPVAGSVTYSVASRTATFTPSAVLASASQYRANITTAATDLAGNALAGNAATSPNAGDHTWNFSTGLAPDTTRPTVTTTDPALAETGVNTTRPITAVFSEGMAPASLTAATFTVATSGGAVPGTVSYSAADRRATFLPDTALATGTQFTATIAAAATDLAGNGLAGDSKALPAASDFTWTFNTAQAPDTVRPTVESTLPADEQANVVTSANITAIFSESMAPASIPASFTVATTAPSVPVPGAVTYSPDDNTATFNPNADLAPGTQYTATITTAATDRTGNGLAGNPALPQAAGSYTWNFTTAALPDLVPPEVFTIFPQRDVTARCQANSIAVRFTEPMNETSINSATFQVSINGAPVSGNITYDMVGGQTEAIFVTTKGVPFTAGSSVLVVVSGGPDGVKDLAGNWMGETYSWSFKIQPAQQCPTPVYLGAATPFGGFGGDAGLTNQGIFTVIDGDIGTTAVCTTVTGFRDNAGDVYDGTNPLNDGKVNGIVYCAPPPPGTALKSETAIQALADARIAFTALAAKPDGSLQGAAGQLGGLVLFPGVYKAADGTYEITGSNLTLDAQGDPNAVWVFQAAESLTVGEMGAPVQVILAGEAKAENVYWQVGSAARIENLSSMVGTIIAQAGVTISTSGQVDLTNLVGRAIGLDASVTMVNTRIRVPPLAPPIP